MFSSVRGVQYIPDIFVNAKIPEGEAHKLPFKSFRTWPLVLWPLPDDFEKLAFSKEYL